MGMQNRPIPSAERWKRSASLCIWVLVAYAAARTEAASPSTPGTATTAAQRLAAVKAGATQVQPAASPPAGEPQWRAGTVRQPDMTVESQHHFAARGNPFCTDSAAPCSSAGRAVQSMQGTSMSKAQMRRQPQTEMCYTAADAGCQPWRLDGDRGMANAQLMGRHSRSSLDTIWGVSAHDGREVLHHTCPSVLSP